MKPNHYMLIASTLGAIALQIQSLHDWHAALNPQFIAGTLGVIALHIGAIYATPPDKKSADVVSLQGRQ